jgi:hypothetical protein
VKRKNHHRALIVPVMLLAGTVCPNGAGLAAQILPPEPPPFIATPERLVEEMLRLGAVSPGDVVYDLGSGDGRLVVGAAVTGARAVGVEYDRDLVEQSRARAARAGVAENTRFLHQDIFETDFHDADVVMLYLSADFNERLRPRLLQQLQPGSRVVSHAFHMGGWTPDTTVSLGSGAERATLYSWIVPASVDGFWSLEVDGMEPLILEFLQAFQVLSGVVSREGRNQGRVSGRMRGEEIRFELSAPESDQHHRQVFTGSLVDGVMIGSSNAFDGRGPRPWRAVRFSDAARAPLGAAQ